MFFQQYFRVIVALVNCSENYQSSCAFLTTLLDQKAIFLELPITFITRFFQRTPHMCFSLECTSLRLLQVMLKEPMTKLLVKLPVKFFRFFQFLTTSHIYEKDNNANQMIFMFILLLGSPLLALILNKLNNCTK